MDPLEDTYSLFFGADYGSERAEFQLLEPSRLVTPDTDLSELRYDFSFEEVAEVFDRIYVPKSGG